MAPDCMPGLDISHHQRLQSNRSSMRRLLNYLLIMGAILAPAPGAGTASAQPYAVQFLSVSNARQSEISQQKAAAIAQKHVNGRVLSVSRSASNYRVKILNRKGNIQVVTVNASDGAILSTR